MSSSSGLFINTSYMPLILLVLCILLYPSKSIGEFAANDLRKGEQKLSLNQREWNGIGDNTNTESKGWTSDLEALKESVTDTTKASRGNLGELHRITKLKGWLFGFLK